MQNPFAGRYAWYRIPADCCFLPVMHATPSLARPCVPVYLYLPTYLLPIRCACWAFLASQPPSQPPVYTIDEERGVSLPASLYLIRSGGLFRIKVTGIISGTV